MCRTCRLDRCRAGTRKLRVTCNVSCNNRLSLAQIPALSQPRHLIKGEATNKLLILLSCTFCVRAASVLAIMISSHDLFRVRVYAAARMIQCVV